VVRPSTLLGAEIGPFQTLPPVKQLMCEVLHSHPDPGGGDYLLALRFIDLNGDQVRLLGRYVLALLRA
jgi:hypothetical protein